LNPLRVLVFSELWHPQGGGAELATNLYTQKMVEAGHKVTIATNEEAPLAPGMRGTSMVRLPFNSSATKVEITLLSGFIERIVRKLACAHDVAYVTGKLLFLVPSLKKANPSIRVIVHLHDYQLLCPHASLYNFIHQTTCGYVWSDLTCAACSGMREFKDRGGADSVVLGSGAAIAWRRLVRASNIGGIVDSTERFVTVSNAQSRLLLANLGRHSGRFNAKQLTLYNPVDLRIDYVPPSFSGEVCLGFLGGENYLKGFDLALDLSRSSAKESRTLLVTKSRHRIGWNSTGD
jgi:hypothetical protein